MNYTQISNNTGVMIKYSTVIKAKDGRSVSNKNRSGHIRSGGYCDGLPIPKDRESVLSITMLNRTMHYKNIHLFCEASIPVSLLMYCANKQMFECLTSIEDSGVTITDKAAMWKLLNLEHNSEEGYNTFCNSLKSANSSGDFKNFVRDAKVVVKDLKEAYNMLPDDVKDELKDQAKEAGKSVLNFMFN